MNIGDTSKPYKNVKQLELERMYFFLVLLLQKQLHSMIFFKFISYCNVTREALAYRMSY